MVIILSGASGVGKSLIEKALEERYGFERIVSCTTRKPREGEADGREYRFMDVDTFRRMAGEGAFAGTDEYSEGRFYGSLKSDYGSGGRVAVLTPGGIRQARKALPGAEVFAVLVRASLGTRLKRYIERCGINKFSFRAKDEAAVRVERDFAMFLGMEREADMVVDNNEGADIYEIAGMIAARAREKRCQAGLGWGMGDEGACSAGTVRGRLYGRGSD